MLMDASLGGSGLVIPNVNCYNWQEKKGCIFAAYHKPFQLLSVPFIVPVQAGSRCCVIRKEGSLSKGDEEWFCVNTISDGTGDNISERNHEFSECTVLYWVWKNIDVDKLDYVGMFQYRRQLILNDFFNEAPNNSEKEVYRCVHFSKDDVNIAEKVGLDENIIRELLKKYDVIIPFSSQLDKMGVESSYEDWVCKIPGVHIGDLVELENVFTNLHPEDSKAFHSYLSGSSKLMYQLFITTPTIFKDYCQWLFEILFEVDKKLDTTLYSVNGRRTLGYLAEILYGFYFTKLKTDHRVLECGVTYLE